MLLEKDCTSTVTRIVFLRVNMLKPSGIINWRAISGNNDAIVDQKKDKIYVSYRFYVVLCKKIKM